MYITAISWDLRHRRAATDFAAGPARKNNRTGLIIPRNMLGADVAGREYRNERRRGCGLLHAGTPYRFFALHRAHRAHTLKSECAGGFDRLHRGIAGGAKFVDDTNPWALLAKAFKPL